MTCWRGSYVTNYFVQLGDYIDEKFTKLQAYLDEILTKIEEKLEELSIEVKTHKKKPPIETKRQKMFDIKCVNDEVMLSEDKSHILVIKSCHLIIYCNIYIFTYRFYVSSKWTFYDPTKKSYLAYSQCIIDDEG